MGTGFLSDTGDINDRTQRDDLLRQGRTTRSASDRRRGRRGGRAPRRSRRRHGRLAEPLDGRLTGCERECVLRPKCKFLTGRDRQFLGGPDRRGSHRRSADAPPPRPERPRPPGTTNPAPGSPNGPFGGLRGLGRFFGGGAGIGFGQITITAISGSDISLKTADGWTRTITVTDATAVTKGGQKITVADLKVGDTIRFTQTRNADGTYAITAVNVVVPRVAGTVTAVSDAGFTIKGRDGVAVTVAVTGSTTYTVGQTAGTKADVTVGVNVEVAGTRESETSFTAISVRIAPALVAGVVTASTDSTITIKRLDGSTATLKVGTGTTFRVPGVNNATIANVAVGMRLIAQVTPNSDGTFNALVVGAGQGIRGGQPGRGGPGRGPQRAPGASPAPTTG